MNNTNTINNTIINLVSDDIYNHLTDGEKIDVSSIRLARKWCKLHDDDKTVDDILTSYAYSLAKQRVAVYKAIYGDQTVDDVERVTNAYTTKASATDFDDVAQTVALLLSSIDRELVNNAVAVNIYDYYVELVKPSFNAVQNYVREQANNPAQIALYAVKYDEDGNEDVDKVTATIDAIVHCTDNYDLSGNALVISQFLSTLTAKQMLAVQLRAKGWKNVKKNGEYKQGKRKGEKFSFYAQEQVYTYSAIARAISRQLHIEYTEQAVKRLFASVYAKAVECGLLDLIDSDFVITDVRQSDKGRKYAERQNIDRATDSYNH